MSYEIGRKLGRKLRSRRAASMTAERSSRLKVWAAKHPVPATLVALVLLALAGWGLATTRDGATTADLVFWELVLVPLGLIVTLIALVRIRRRRRI